MKRKLLWLLLGLFALIMFLPIWIAVTGAFSSQWELKENLRPVLGSGQLTSETTAFLLADSGQGWKFTADVTQDQSKYIGTGEKVTLRRESSGKEDKDLPIVAFAVKDIGGTLTVSLPAADIPLGAGIGQ